MLRLKGKFSLLSSSRREENNVERRKSPLKIWQVLSKVALYYHKASFLMLGWRELSYSSSLILCVRGVELIIKYPSIYSLLKDDTLFFSSQNADTADPFHCLAQL